MKMDRVYKKGMKKGFRKKRFGKKFKRKKGLKLKKQQAVQLKVSKPKGVTKEEMAKARELAQRSNIPENYALRVVRGKMTLNDVLKRLMAQETAKKLIAQGMSPDYALNVAEGRITKEKALMLQKLREIQGRGYKWNAIADIPRGVEVCFSIFGEGTAVYKVKKVLRYEVFCQKDSEKRMIKKHDIKFFCAPEHLEIVLQGFGWDEEIKKLGLLGTDKLEERFRPTVELALEWLQKRPTLRFYLRDGETITGKVERVGRFDIEVSIGGASVSLLTHALYKPKPFEVVQV
jgi:sRNA-binding regulator protein Hfq